MKTTRTKFWETLATTRGWKLVDGRAIRRVNKHGVTICPVCAVANKLIKKAVFDTDQTEAAEAIGLNLDFADNIADAADISKNTKLRRKLLKVTKPREEGVS